MDVPRHWRLKAQRYRLEGALCPVCGRPSFPPRPACPDCIERRMTIVDTRLSVTTPLSDIAGLPSSLCLHAIESTIG
jgi:uncharacterized OB-fold protein